MMLSVWCPLVLLVLPIMGQVQQLGQYNIDPSKISVSGFSAGGCFATQFHVAYSAAMAGMASFAGTPYMCAPVHGGDCPFRGANVDNDELVRFTNEFSDAGLIDDISNMADDKVLIWNGFDDTITHVTQVGAFERYYNEFLNDPVSDMVLERWDGAEHNQPVDREDGIGSPCHVQDSCGPGWCAYDGAYETLNFIHDGIVPPALDRPGLLYNFSQDQFVPGGGSADTISMDDIGVVYVPTGCIDGSEACGIHVVFHGCYGGISDVGYCFVNGAGYSEVGESNNYIILHPMIKRKAAVGNPWACWDWWGYLDSNQQENRFAHKDGPQMETVMNMIDYLAAGNLPPPDKKH